MRIRAGRVLTRLAALAGAVALAATVGAAPASASADGFAYTEFYGKFDSYAGTAYFQAYGDKFILEDRYADGAGVFLWYLVAGSTAHTLYWGGGAGTSHTFNLEFAENKQVQFYVCLQDDGVIQTHTCSAVEYAVS